VVPSNPAKKKLRNIAYLQFRLSGTAGGLGYLPRRLSTGNVGEQLDRLTAACDVVPIFLN
jgi:hypothetical protein